MNYRILAHPFAAMSCPYYMPMFAAPGSADTPMRDRLLVVALVVLVHVALLSSWDGTTVPSSQVNREMSVSLAMADLAQHDFPPPSPPQAALSEPAPQPVAKPRPVVPQQPAAQVAAAAPSVAAQPVAVQAAPQQAADAAAAQPVNAAAALPDREPDYQAAYLRNPPPAYPMTARRMGWQGRVVLSVEVLSTGLPGQISVQQSSGHEVLDNAALQAVRGWRFVAARQGGQVVARQVLVPIPFILKEAE
ncbi:MAG TPA: energy transducer TonB [Gallionella sp.]|nr:energy transducer TonB [Gallionella sp.]